jgi:hypothetical protein
LDERQQFVVINRLAGDDSNSVALLLRSAGILRCGSDTK